MREHYHRLPTPQIAAHLQRTVGAVKKVAERLGVVRANHAPYRWTPRRWSAFGELYRRDPGEAARRFGLTRMSANAYASRLGYHVRRPWTPGDDAVLRELWPQYQDAALRERLCRSQRALLSRAFKIGLRRPAVHNWTKWRFSA